MPVAMTRIFDDRVVVAVDPHRRRGPRPWWMVLQPLATVRAPVICDGYRALRWFAHRWPHGIVKLSNQTRIEAMRSREPPGHM